MFREMEGLGGSLEDRFLGEEGMRYEVWIAEPKMLRLADGLEDKRLPTSKESIVQQWQILRIGGVSQLYSTLVYFIHLP